jgi:short-subunit dehydrogenase
MGRALITSAARGIGLAIAPRLTVRHMALIMTARNKARWWQHASNGAN